MAALAESMGSDSNSGELTRNKIMDAAEGLIVANGFAATSLRAIANAAGVNLAATHYHFGSKRGLLAAVFHRRMGPMGCTRLAALTELEASGEPVTVRAILQAFFAPFQEAEGAELPILQGLVACIYAEPPSLTESHLEDEFSETISRFVAALCASCPGVPEEEMRWRFHFMIGSMIQFLKFDVPLGFEREDGNFQEGLKRLLVFAEKGIQQSGDDL